MKTKTLIEATCFNDNDVAVKIPAETMLGKLFIKRLDHEAVFRKLTSFMINKNIIDSTKNIIDLGAWIGDNAIPWAKNIAGTVYAIDPSERNCKFIKEMSEFNEVNNIKIIKTAVSDKIEILGTNDSINHASFVYKPTDSPKTHIESTTLDHLYDNGDIRSVGYIHLDVEGMELRVLAGSKKLIKECQPVIVWEGHLNMKLDDIQGSINLLDEYGYASYMINERLKGCRPDCRNFISLPYSQNCKEVVETINETFPFLLSEYIVLF